MRQVLAAGHPVRSAAARPRQDPDRGPGDAFQRCVRRGPAGDRDGGPGDRRRGRPDGRRERADGTDGARTGRHRLESQPGPGPADPRPSRTGLRPALDRRPAPTGPEADGRDRPGDLTGREDPDPGRADQLTDRGRGCRPVRGDPRTGAARRRGPVRLTSARRGVRDQRRDHGHAQRADGRHRPGQHLHDPVAGRRDGRRSGSARRPGSRHGVAVQPRSGAACARSA